MCGNKEGQGGKGGEGAWGCGLVKDMEVWNELSGSENPVCFGGYLGDDLVRCFRACL